MYERFTDLARKVMQLANQEAQRFNHEYIDAEHILIAIAKEGGGMAATFLGTDALGNIIRIVRQRLTPGKDMITMGKLPQTERARKVIELAISEARGFHHNYVGTEHMLLGVLAEQTGIACEVLRELGVKDNDIREKIKAEIAKVSMTHEEETKAMYDKSYARIATSPFLASTVEHFKIGSTITIDCGDLPHIPGWLRVEVDRIIERLNMEIRRNWEEKRAQQI